MFDRLAKFLRAPEAKASRTAQLIALQSGGRARWTPRDYASLARTGYVSNAIVYRAVKLVAGNVGGCAYLEEEGGETRDRHPLIELIAQPNPRQDGAQLLEAVATHLLLAGNAYLEAVAVDNAPRELHVLRPDRIKLVPGADGWPEAYDYTVAGRTVRFDQSGAPPPILHLTLLHPLDDHYGLAPLEAAAVAVDTHNAAAKWNKALLDNAAQPCGALVFTGADAAGRSTERALAPRAGRGGGASGARRPPRRGGGGGGGGPGGGGGGGGVEFFFPPPPPGGGGGGPAGGGGGGGEKAIVCGCP